MILPAWGIHPENDRTIRPSLLPSWMARVVRARQGEGGDSRSAGTRLGMTRPLREPRRRPGRSPQHLRSIPQERPRISLETARSSSGLSGKTRRNHRASWESGNASSRWNSSSR
jgi:hypothetical protein